MRVHAVCYYRSKSDEWTDKWRDVDYTARNLVKAVKRKPFNGFSLIRTVAGKVFRVESTPNGQAVAMGYAAQMLAKKMTEAGYENAFVVPIPSSTHINYGQEFTGSRIASAVQERNPNFLSTPILHFDVPQPKSAAGGGRNTYEIERHLRAAAFDRHMGPVVLLDDVYTSGAHVRAATRFLARHNIIVEDAFVVGRTIWAKPDSMFRCAPEEICA